MARVPEPELTKDYYIERRNGKKRNYIYDFAKARRCTHPHLTELAIGGSWYRCDDCNYAFNIVASSMQPLHNLVIGGILNALHFAKEYGGDSFNEVLRTPIGQYDGTSHKPAIPEGMTFADAIAALEVIDVNSEDHGQAELREVLESQWAGPKERALADKQRDRRLAKEQKKALNGGDSATGASASDRDEAVSSLQERTGEAASDGDT